MNISDGIKLIGSPAEIPDCPRNGLPAFLKQLGFNVGAEVGVYRGDFTEKFCREGLKMYAIDPWIGYSGAGRSEKKQDMQDYNFGCAKKILSPYPDCRLIRKTSMEALSDFKPNSLDFVYIDGDHRFKYIAEDLFEWYEKVKPGGVISGHDYFCTGPGANNVICHVQPVVDAFIKTMQIPNFYVFGRLDPAKQKTKDDRTLSWMFFKNPHYQAGQV